jgi:hypothetical protein
MIDKKYLVWRFMKNNHAKYRKYCTEWIDSLTNEQLHYFQEEKERLTLKGEYKND